MRNMTTVVRRVSEAEFFGPTSEHHYRNMGWLSDRGLDPREALSGSLVVIERLGRLRLSARIVRRENGNPVVRGNRIAYDRRSVPIDRVPDWLGGAV